MEKNKKENVQHIEGISCSVRNCMYHDGESFCTTDKICVGPCHASSSTDTICATFKPRNF